MLISHQMKCIISSSDKEVGVVIKSEVYLIWVIWVIYAHFEEVSFELCCRVFNKYIEDYLCVAYVRKNVIVCSFSHGSGS